MPATSTTEFIGQAIGKGIAMGIIKSRAKRHFVTCLERIQSQGVTLYRPDGTPVPPGGTVTDASLASSSADNENAAAGDLPYGCHKKAPVMYRGDLICVRD
ncbi:MAG: hypothetical protein ACRBBO_14880 [Cognatishimia sp.]|uniref:hypothetical protein n=1 Tax=Cognatishimia sp. 1_MG-2023 TaxID=3062642 RepID=UPI0026E1DA2A|nr:hypothetical protein [Cognatishimia sp. 1_MG-2023]MDO6726147.1 hypothetical protein [Cognatishimia sp. 1_MG-2023]